MTEEINEIETSFKGIMDENHSPILTIPGISYRMGAMILAEKSDRRRAHLPAACIYILEPRNARYFLLLGFMLCRKDYCPIL